MRGGAGVGREKRVGDDRQRTPPPKIRRQFQGYKHTSLILTVHESLEALALLGSENDPRNVCRNAWETVVL